MSIEEAQQVRLGDIVDYHGGLYRVTGITATGIGAPLFRLVAVDGRGAISLLSHVQVYRARELTLANTVAYERTLR